MYDLVAKETILLSLTSTEQLIVKLIVTVGMKGRFHRFLECDRGGLSENGVNNDLMQRQY